MSRKTTPVTIPLPAFETELAEQPTKLLLVTPEKDFCRQIRHYLADAQRNREGRFRVLQTGNATAAAKRLVGGEYAACLVDAACFEQDACKLGEWVLKLRERGYLLPILILVEERGWQWENLARNAENVDWLARAILSHSLLARTIHYAVGQAQSALLLQKAEQGRRLLDLMVNNLASGVLVTDPNQPDNPIIFANPSFTIITGYTDEEAIGRNCRFLQGDQTDPATVTKIREALQQKVPFRGLIQNYRKDGTQFCNGLVIVPVMDEVGELTHFIGVINDVSAPREQLRALAARTTAVREEERTSIAREIHDELGQMLTALKLDLSSMNKRVTSIKDRELSQNLVERIAQMTQLADATIQSVRKIASQLRPALLDDLGLEAAIEWQTQDFRQRTGIRCVVDSQLENVELDQEQATMVFRILQEALTNVMRHAVATRVDISVGVNADTLLLRLKDNGRGISKEEKANMKSLGLLGMRERALVVGGEVDISGTKGRGTIVTLRMPLQKPV